MRRDTRGASFFGCWLLLMGFGSADLEAVFRSLKSELGFCPVYHRTDGRVDGYLFITVLAYQFMQLISSPPAPAWHQRPLAASARHPRRSVPGHHHLLPC